MAFKTFAPGVLTSSDVNTFLMRQAVITCTSSTRPASPSEGMTIYETDTNLHKFYDGSAWRGVGEYVSYTPTLTNMTLGNGTLDASFTRIGSLVIAKCALTAGSTTTLDNDASTIFFSYPVAQTGGSRLGQLGNAQLVDSSTGVVFQCLVRAGTGTGIRIDRTTTLGGSAYLSGQRIQSGTFSIDTGDKLRWSIAYEGVTT